MRPTPTATGAGRFAPTPSGDLHLGNLRTALLAWLFAKSTRRRFLVRIDDLDRERVRPGAVERQLADLAAVGLTWEQPVLRQSQRLPRYQVALDKLTAAGLTYECFCTRREVLQAAAAPHGPVGAYPGTCRNLSEAQRAAQRAAGRMAALRLRAQVSNLEIVDECHGPYCGVVDDMVLRRADGTPAYNLAVVVDDADQGIDQVVRGDDLLPSTPRQAYLATELGLPVPRYAHVPLVLNAQRKRLAKRDGAVTLGDRARLGESAEEVFAVLAHSLGYRARDPLTLLQCFDPDKLPRNPWIFEPDRLLHSGRCP